MSEACTALAVRPRAPKPTRIRSPITPPPRYDDDLGEPVGSLDIELAPSRDEQLAYLDAARLSPPEYGRAFLICCAQLGVTLHVGSRHGNLIAGFGADERVRDRQDRLTPIVDHMDRWDMRAAVISAARLHGPFSDRRANDPRRTTKVLRDFLAAGYRLYLTPGNWVEEGGARPIEWHETADQGRADEIMRDGCAYLQLRFRYAARSQIERAVRMLGKRNAAGALVLERRS